MRKVSLFTIVSIVVASCNMFNNYENDMDLDELKELNQKALSFEDAGDFHNDLLAVKMEGMWGLINYKTDELVINFQYDTISYSNGWWRLDISDAWAVCKTDVADENGERLKFNDNLYHTIPLTKDVLVNHYENGVNIKEVIIDSKYNTLLTDTFSMFKGKGHNYVFVDKMRKGVCTLVTIEDGGLTTTTLPDEYEDVQCCSDDGIYAVKDKNDKWGFIDKNGKVIIPCKYGVIGEGFKNGLAIVGDSWDALNTIININDTKVIKMDDASMIFPFSEGLAGANKKDGCVFIDENGKIKIELDNVGCFGGFVNDVAVVAQGGEDEYGLDSKVGVINKDGVYIIPLQDDNIDESNVSNGFFIACDNVVTIGGKYGLFNIKGERLLDTKYDLISYSERGVIRVKRNGHSYYVNQKGETGFTNLDDAISEGEKVKKVKLAKGYDGRFEKTRIMEWNIFCLFNKNCPNILKDISGIENFKKNADGTYSAEVSFQNADGKYCYKLSKMRFNEKGHFNNSVKPWKVEVNYVPTGRYVYGDRDDVVYSLPVHLPNAEEQLMYYNNILMQGNRYNPFK